MVSKKTFLLLGFCLVFVFIVVFLDAILRKVPRNVSRTLPRENGNDIWSDKNASNAANPSTVRAEIRAVRFTNVTISVSIASTKEEIIKGLSGVEFLEPLSGKLFIFPRENYWSFWMKDMKFPLDIIWINKNLEVVSIAEKIGPNSFPEVFKPSRSAMYVLEVNAGLAAAYGIHVGDRVIFTF